MQKTPLAIVLIFQLLRFTLWAYPCRLKETIIVTSDLSICFCHVGSVYHITGHNHWPVDYLKVTLAWLLQCNMKESAKRHYVELPTTLPQRWLARKGIVLKLMSGLWAALCEYCTVESFSHGYLVVFPLLVKQAFKCSLLVAGIHYLWGNLHLKLPALRRHTCG